MRHVYKRKAWLLDEDILLMGYTTKKKFVPIDKLCGFSYQRFCKKDINKILFYSVASITSAGLSELEVQ